MSEPEVSATRWREALATFERLQDLDVARRAADLESLRRESPDLHALVLTLLDADERAEVGDYLEAGPMSEVPSASVAGATVGPYRLERSLGEGGMGAVWLARRADGVFETPVALKLLHGHLALSGSARERFVREGRILGELAHPNVARLLDAGVTPRGQLYLALEYVEGGRLDRYCDDRRLTVDERLKLVQQVCAALAHAHARLVVHRDVKPSNILVTTEGEVKLLDFGIAKLVEQQTGSEVTELTHLGGRVLTPEFAAPEQVLGGTITVATDVYALGVLLYALLGGWRPYGPRGAAPTLIERAVLEAEPTPLSRARPLSEEDPTPLEIAARRSTTPAKLSDALRGDLDVIVARALKKNPEERYPTIAALSEDLRRYLAHEPVLARPDTATYRARKFLRRHRVGMSAAAAVTLAVLAGSGVALWQAERARAEASKADAVKEFILGIFSMNSVEGESPAAARQTTVEQLLKLGTDRVTGEFEGQPVVKAELLGVLGSLNQELERYDEAQSLRRERLRVMKGLGVGAQARAAAMIDLAETETGREAYTEARHQLDDAQKLLDERGQGQSLEQARLLLASAQLLRFTTRKHDPGALHDARRALTILEQHYPDSVERVQALYLVGLTTYNVGDARASQDIVRQGVALAREKHPRRKWLTGAGAAALSGVTDYDNWQEFIRVNREALDILVQVYGADHPRTAIAEVELGSTLHDTTERAQGLTLIESGTAKLVKALPDDRDESLDARMMLGTAYMFEGRFQQALPLLEAVAQQWMLKDPESVGNATAQLRVGTLYTQLGRYDAAGEHLRRAIEIRMRVRGPRHLYTAQAHFKYGELLRASGKTQAALEAFAHAHEILEDGSSVLPDSIYVVEVAQAGLLNDIGRTREAITLAQGAVEGMRDASYDIEGTLAYALYEWGRAERLQGDAGAAVPRLKEAVTIMKRADWQHEPSLALIHIELARCLWRSGMRDEARRALSLAEGAFTMQPELGEHLRAPLRAARKEIGT